MKIRIESFGSANPCAYIVANDGSLIPLSGIQQIIICLANTLPAAIGMSTVLQSPPIKLSATIACDGYRIEADEVELSHPLNFP